MRAEAVRPRSATGPRGLPIVGNLPSFLADKLGFLTRAAARYGDVVRLELGGTTLLLNHPDDVKHVLIGNPDNYDKSPRLTSPRGKRLSGSGLLTSVGEAHLARRRQMQPVFHRDAIAGFDRVVERGTNEMLARWTDGARFDVAAEMMRLAQTNIVRAVFGDELDDRAAEIGAAIDARRRYMAQVFFVPFGDRLPTPVARAYRNAMRWIRSAVDEAIARRRTDTGAPTDLLGALLGAEAEDGSRMSHAALRDEAITLLVTGYETVGEALAWTWYLVGRHAEVRAALEAEVDEVLGGRFPSAADVRDLRLTARILNESMRLYPPTWIFVRIAKESDVLPTGHAVPARAKLYLSPYVVQRDARYFPNPEVFDPDRFDDTQRRTRPPLAYFPFGGGLRVCIGEALARMEATQIIAAVAQRFRCELDDARPIVAEPRMTLRPKGGIRVTARRREPRLATPSSQAASGAR